MSLKSLVNQVMHVEPVSNIRFHRKFKNQQPVNGNDPCMGHDQLSGGEIDVWRYFTHNQGDWLLIYGSDMYIVVGWYRLSYASYGLAMGIYPTFLYLDLGKLGLISHPEVAGGILHIIHHQSPIRCDDILRENPLSGKQNLAGRKLIHYNSYVVYILISVMINNEEVKIILHIFCLQVMNVQLYNILYLMVYKI